MYDAAKQISHVSAAHVDMCHMNGHRRTRPRTQTRHRLTHAAMQRALICHNSKTLAGIYSDSSSPPRAPAPAHVPALSRSAITAAFHSRVVTRFSLSSTCLNRLRCRTVRHPVPSQLPALSLNYHWERPFRRHAHSASHHAVPSITSRIATRSKTNAALLAATAAATATAAGPSRRSLAACTRARSSAEKSLLVTY